MSIRSKFASKRRILAPFDLRLRNRSLHWICPPFHALHLQSELKRSYAQASRDTYGADKLKIKPLEFQESAQEGIWRLSIPAETTDKPSSDFRPANASILDNGHQCSNLFYSQPNKDLRALRWQRYNQAWKFSFDSLWHMKLHATEDANDSVLRAAQRGFALTFCSGRSTEELRDRWSMMPQDIQFRRLPFILVGSLSISAELALCVLAALPPLPNDFRIRMDCLVYLRRHKPRWAQIEADKGLLEQFHSQLREQLSNSFLPPFAVEQSQVGLIVDESSIDESCRFLDRYLMTYTQPQTLVLLQFIDLFTKRGDIDRAIALFRRLPSEHLAGDDDMATRDLVLQRCTNLLMLDTVDVSGETKNFKILPQLLELGIRPNVFIHNMIIRNAFAAGISGVGWDLYRYMRSERIETNPVTYVMLLKDAFSRQDVQCLNEVLSAVHQREDLYHSPLLVAQTMNIVRLIYTHERRAGPLEAFSHLLSVYSRAFNLKVLARLGLLGHSIRQESLALAKQPDPHPISLASAIWSYVLVQTNPHWVDRLWVKLKTLIVRGDREIVEAAKHEIFYNGFVVFYGRSPQTLERCAEVVHFMLDSQLCEPGSRTWSMLMCGFLRQGQHTAAEQIRQTMVNKGFEPKSKAFEFLLEKWPESEVATRARETLRSGILEQRADIDSLQDGDLFEGVPRADERIRWDNTATEETMQWHGMVNLRALPGSRMPVQAAAL